MQWEIFAMKWFSWTLQKFLECVGLQYFKPCMSPKFLLKFCYLQHIEVVHVCSYIHACTSKWIYIDLIQVRRENYRFLQEPEFREEGGTPAIVESIRAGLVFQLKNAVSEQTIMEKEEHFHRCKFYIGAFSFSTDWIWNLCILWVQVTFDY